MNKRINALTRLIISVFFMLTVLEPVKAMAIDLEVNKSILVLSVDDFDAFKGCELKDESLGAIEEIGILRLAIQTDHADERIAYYTSCPSVNEAYLEHKSTLSLVPTDPAYASNQWNLQQMGMEETWEITTGSSDIIVAVIDTGVDVYSSLSDFDENSFVLGASFLTDMSGMSFIQEDQYLGQFSYDGGSHGTAVSSVIGAEINGSKIAGIAPDVKIMPLKVFLDEVPGGDIYANNSDVAAAIVWAADHGADIINLSLGGPDDSALYNACKYAYGLGVIIVAATGNDSDHAGNYPPFYRVTHTAMAAPARYNEVIGVGSINQSNYLSNFSNIGNSAYQLELVAYGESIFLPWNQDGMYELMDGTSFSSPEVAGVLALMLSVNPTLDPNEARAILISAADDLTGPYMGTYYDDYSGFGKLDPLQSVQESQSYDRSEDANHDQASALRLMAGTNLTGRFESILDDDYYVITLYEYTNYEISVTPSGAENPVIKVYDAQMKQLDAWTSNSKAGYAERISGPSNPGTYYFVVTDADGRKYSSDYTVTTTFSNSPTSKIEASTSEGPILNHGQAFSDVTVQIKTAMTHTLSVTKDGVPYELPADMVFTEAGYYVLTLDDIKNPPMTFDFTLKTLVISGVGNTKIYNNSRTITFSSGTATLDGNVFLSGDTVSAEGTHTLVVTDGADISSLTFTIDLTAPTTNMIEGKKYWGYQYVDFNEGTATLNGEKITNHTQVSFDRAYTLVITDTAGNVTTVHFTVILYMSSPGVSFTTTSDSVSMTFSAVQYDTVQISISTLSDSGFTVLGTYPLTEKFTVNGLQPEMMYYFRFVTSVTIDGVTRTSPTTSYETYTQSATIIYPQMDYIEVTANPNFSATIKWPAVPGAEGYELWTLNWSETLITTTTATSYTHTNLTPVSMYNQYHYGIRYFKTVNGVKKYSDMRAMYFYYTIPAPANVKAISKSLTSIELTWDLMPGMTSYKINYMDTETGTPKTMTVTTNKATLVGLLPNKTYGFTVAGAVTKNYTPYVGTYSNPVYTFTAVTPPALTGTVKGISSLNLSWKSVTGAVGYSLSYYDESVDDYVFLLDTNLTTLDLSGLTMGKAYTFKIYAFSFLRGIRYYSEDSNALTLTPAPVAITGLKNTLATINSLTIGWNAMDGAEGYEVCQAATATSTCVSLGTTTSTSFEKTGLLFNTSYYYQVRAYLTYEGQRIYGAYSARIAFKTAVPAVTGLIASSLNYNTNGISWDAVSGASGYDIYYSIGASTTFVLLRSVTTNSTTHTGLLTNTKYNYKVRATKTVSLVKYTGALSLAVSSTPIPSAPVISAISTGTDSIKATWAAVSGATGYEVTRSLNADFSAPAILTQTSNIFTLSGLATDVPVYLKVRAYRLVGTLKVYSSVSNTIGIKPVPNTPVMVGSILDYQGIRLTWNSILNAGGYELYKQNLDTLAFELIQDNLNLSYTENGLTAGSVNIFKIKAYVLVNDVRIYSNDSPSLSLSPVPSSVTGLSVSLPKYTQLSLNWNAVTGATGYEITRSTTATGTFVLVSTVEDGLTFTDTGLVFNTSYFYKVRAYTTINGSKVYASATASVSGKTALEIVLNPKVVYTAYNSNQITWSPVTGATGYEVYRSIGTSTTYALVGTVTTTTFNNTLLLTNTKYNYKIRAYRLVGTVKVYGAFSTVVSSTPLPLAPIVTVTSLAYNSLKVTWPAVGGANGYEVSYATSETGTYKKLALVTTNSASIISLLTDTTYYVKVRAYRIINYVKIYGASSVVVTGKPIPSTPVVTAVSTGFNSVKLSWLAIAGASGYEVYMLAPESSDYYMVEDVAVLTSTVTRLMTGSTYNFKVKAYRLVNSVRVYSLDSIAKPATPLPSLVTGFKVAMPSVTSLKLSWTGVAGATGYEISKSTALAGTYSVIGTVEGNTEFTVTGLIFNSITYYKVRAYTIVNDVKNYGTNTLGLTGKTMPSTVQLNLVNSAYNANTLSWPAVEGATAYEIYYSSGTSTYYTLLKTQTLTSFVHTALLFNTQYNYKVRAYKLVGTVKYYGAYSTLTSVKTAVGAPAAIVSSTHDSIGLTWNAVIGASGYEVSFATSLAGPYTVTTQTGVSKTFSALTTGTTYYIKLRSYRLISTTKVYGPYSSVITVTPKLEVPNLQLTGLTSTTATFTWVAVAGATDYEVRIISDAVGAEWFVESVSELTVTFSDLDPAAHYTVEIRAVKKIAEVPYYSEYSGDTVFSYSDTN